jgi:hypothetical protein
MHPFPARLRIPYMTGLVILLAILAVPYVALNVRRLVLGRSWAFTFCQVAKEWEERERQKRLAARRSARPKARTSETLRCDTASDDA